MNKKELKNNELGTLFEKATIPILTGLFVCWGYEVIDSIRQKPGTQHGFDILFKLSKNDIPLYIFVECKASGKYNEIDVYELKKKIDQFDWANYPHKDIHLFLSLTRSVKFNNEINGIEDNTLPFVIIDWMRKPGTIHPFVELFFAYEGDSPDVLQYRDGLKMVATEVLPAKTFPAIAKELWLAFEPRINDYYGIEYRQDCQFISGAFWQRVRECTTEDHINHYYIKIDSKKSRLQEVVSSGSYIRNRKVEKEFEEILAKTAGLDNALVEILSQGGEGKSTFMHHIAKYYYRDYNIFYLYSFDDEILESVRSALRRLNNCRPVMLLLDDASAYGDYLPRLKNRLDLGFRDYKLVFVAAERNFRYNHIEDLDSFRNIFDEVYHLNFITNPDVMGRIFDRFFSILNAGDGLTREKQSELRRIYLEDNRRSTTENAYSVFKCLTETEKARIKYAFDWEDWEKFAVGKYSPLEKLYLLLATFYQFGFSLDMEFCAAFLGTDAIDINNAMESDRNLPIYKWQRKLYLRHESNADWFLEDKKNRENSESIFKKFLMLVNTPIARGLFMRLYKDKEFMTSYLGKYLTEEKRIEILAHYIETHPGELNCRTELSKIYQHQKRWEEAESILIELKNIDPDNLPARTELSKIYQHQKRWEEAESILIELKNIDPDNLPARTELSKIYQQQKKWQEAETILLESLKIDANQLHPRTELSKIYQQQKKWQEAETILLESLKIDPDQLHPRTELSKIYQQQKKWQEAETILLESLKIDADQLHPRTELSKIYQQQKKWQEAETILLELKNLDPNNLQARTELSKIYQQQKKWNEAIRYLKEYLELDPKGLHPRTELSKIYQQQKRWDDAEKILMECLDIEKNDLDSRTELSKIYQQQDKWKEAEEILLECLKIKKHDINAMLELGRLYSNSNRPADAEYHLKKTLEIEPKNLHALTELSFLFNKMKHYGNREEILFEIYNLNPGDIHNLTALSSMFTRFRKYRIAIKLLETALAAKDDDLLSVILLIELYKTLIDKKNVAAYYEKGKAILSKHQINKYKERFLQLTVDIDNQAQLLELMNTGIFHRDQNGISIECGDIHYPLATGATCNNKIKNGDAVYFATYTNGKDIYADFIEPYFENLDNLRALK